MTVPATGSGPVGRAVETSGAAAGAAADPRQDRRAGFLAIELDGAGWNGTGLDGGKGFASLAEAVLSAESAGFHVATFAGSPSRGRTDAVQRAAYSGPLTRTIALVPEVDTVYTEPFHVSTQLASLDYVSGGRAGWIVTAEESPAAAAAVGRDPVSGTALAQEAAASIEVSRRLWDSWEDDAVIRDVATGRYIDADKLHYVDFETPEGFGAAYSVKGPSIIPRPLQGHLPVLAAASIVGEGRIPVDAVDAVLVSAPTPELLLTEIRDLRGRWGASVAVVAELDVVLDARGQSSAERVTGGQSSRARFSGPAADLVQVLEPLLREADGIRLHPESLAVDLDELARLVLPDLRRRGALLAPVQDGTFRDLLGCARPASRYADSSTATAARN